MDVLYLVMLMYVYDELALWITRSMHNTYYVLVVLIITNSLLEYAWNALLLLFVIIFI